MRQMAAKRFLIWCFALLVLATPLCTAALDRFIPVHAAGPALTSQEIDSGKILRPQHLWDGLYRPARPDPGDRAYGGGSDLHLLAGNRLDTPPFALLKAEAAATFLGVALHRGHPQPRAPPSA